MKNILGIEYDTFPSYGRARSMHDFKVRHIESGTQTYYKQSRPNFNVIYTCTHGFCEARMQKKYKGDGGIFEIEIDLLDGYLHTYHRHGERWFHDYECLYSVCK